MIQYKYAFDANGVMVHIKDVPEEGHLKMKFTCVGCGEEMKACIGTKRRYFRHAVEGNCNLEHYLHQLGKYNLKERFDNRNLPFTIMLKRGVVCSDEKKCIFYNESSCWQAVELNPIDLHSLYDTCGIEKDLYVDPEDKNPIPTYEPADGKMHFRADLLLRDSKHPQKRPVLLEVVYTHKCEQKKIDSGLKIIEIPISCEDDANRLLTCTFQENLESNNQYYDEREYDESYLFQNREEVQPIDNKAYPSTFYNFTPNLPQIKLEGGIIQRFYFFKTGSALVNQLHEGISCSHMHDKLNRSSLFELNIDAPYLGDVNVYHCGLVYILDKGHNVRNCILCRYYVNPLDSYWGYPFCKKHRCRTKQNDAMQCSWYSPDQLLIQKARKILQENAVVEVEPIPDLKK